MALVMVVDDEPDVRLALSSLLADEGHDTVEAGDGSEVMDRIKETRPDLILLDLMLPGMDGFEILKAVSKEPDAAGSKVIVLTARCGTEDMTLARALGAVDYVSKPWAPGSLEAKVRAALRN